MLEERRLTIREAYSEASSFLRRHGVRDPEANAERLLEHVLGESRSGMLLRWGEKFPVEQLGNWKALLERKAAGEPVQYIIGEQEFYGHAFEVTPAVLIPRPETELLVEEVLRLGRLLWSAEAVDSGTGLLRHADGAEEREAVRHRPTVCDIGTGSGAIALTLAATCADWRVLASDLSAEALAVARSNALRLGVGERVTFAEGDLLRPWIERRERIDILVSNPPYIPEADEPGLQPEVRLYEPRTALYGGEDGLVLYRRMTAQLAELVALPRLVGFEVGFGQAQAVRGLLEQAGDWDDLYVVPDLAGIERHVIAYRK
ncbi:peptide chain release factor N(5)-glutamine methyltransferase [Paenibacillus sp. tmac-D7]|uniref:peptide chain release factor N(5)-glutamine methyltransferase n=1 Tax=Paenibacillus sp. tmac-D7 TaxID=2591462 RepID=UPI0011415857|nr:peptide chain release factor N(5)-glutamine methyltransferase [Paenibacillus sp. tmac-D7]